MSPLRELVSERLPAALAGDRAEHRLSFQARATGRNTVGSPTGAWGAVAGLQGLPARISANTGPQETERPDQTFTVSTYRAALFGDYAIVDTMRATDQDGQLYDVEGVQHDSARAFTYVDLEVATS